MTLDSGQKANNILKQQQTDYSSFVCLELY